MPGRNKYSPANVIYAKNGFPAVTGTCVFISHKRENAEMAVEVATLLSDFEVDYWLDIEELNKSEPKLPSDHRTLAEAIEAGIASCTHLLALITPETKQSWWVPYEIGTARAKTKQLAFLLHRDLDTMPSYFIFGEWLNDQKDLFSWAERISSEPIIAKIGSIARRLDTGKLDPYVIKNRVYRAQ